MIKKIGIFSVAAAILFSPLISFAEPSVGGSIVVMSKQETGLPEYVHEKYMFIHPDCLAPQMVDHYGPPVDPNDANLLWAERQICLRANEG